ncbi:hypothetical protein GCM10027059_48370 [Myceligenerans halotolerans]
MHTSDTHVRPASSRRLVLTMAVTVALLCTGAAFEGMFGFGRDMLGWNITIAIAFAGIFELAQLTVALLAREAMRDGRPAGTLLTITWMLAAASGVLAAWEELSSGHGLAAALFRILAPVLAAGLWHLVLIGDRHLATGRSWAQMRAAARMHALFLTVEDAARAHETGKGIARAEARRRRARAVALKTVPPEQMRAHVADWLDSLSAVADATTDVARLHVQTNQRVAGATSTPVPSALVFGPDYTGRTADAITAEVADIHANTAPVRSGQGDGQVSGRPAGRSGGQSPRTGGSVRPARRTTPRQTQRPARPSRAETAARMAVVSALVSARPDATGPDVVSALADAGHDVADGVARRYLRNVRAGQSGTATTTHTTDDVAATPDAETTNADMGSTTSTPTVVPVLAEVN